MHKQDSLEQNRIEVFTKVEVAAEFTGGMNKMFKYLSTNILYPQESIAKGETGTVVIRMIIHEDGSITDIEILKGVSESIDTEALRVVNSMPNWTPAYMTEERTKAVPCYFTLPIRFRLDTKTLKKAVKNGY